MSLSNHQDINCGTSGQESARSEARERFSMSDFLKKGTTILVWATIFFIFHACVSSNVNTRRRGDRRSQIRLEAKEIWRGKYSSEDLAKWERRLRKMRSKKNWNNTALCLNVIGVLHFYQGNSDKALEYLDQAVKLDRSHGLEENVARDLQKLGDIQRRKGLLEEALKSFNESLSVAERLDMMGMVEKNLRKIGKILLARGRYQESLDYLNEVLEIAERRQDERSMMIFLNHLGGLYKRQGNFEKAKGYFRRSLKISEELGDRRWMAGNINNLGDICSREKDYGCAIKNYKQSLAFFEALNNKTGLVKTQKRLGKFHLKLEENEIALQYLQKSNALAQTMGLKIEVASTWQQIGEVYSRMGKWADALEKTDEAIDIFKELDIPDALRQSYHKRGRYLEQTGDIDGAEKSYKESVKILETLRDDVAGGEEDLAVFVERRGRVYQRLIALLLRQGKIPEALKYLERSRLKKLRDQFDELRPELRDEEENRARDREQKLREEIELARIHLSKELSKPKSERDAQRIAQLRKTLSDKRRNHTDYLEDLRTRFPDLASHLAIQPEALVDLQRLLPKRAAIVQYLILEKQLFIFVVSRESISYREVKVTQRDLEGKIDYLRSILMNPQMALTMGPLDVETLKPKDAGDGPAYEMVIAPFVEVSRELHRILIRPVEKEISRFPLLGIIPNGKLHLLPFQALGENDLKGNFRFLAEQKALFQLNSQSILKFLQQKAKRFGERGRLIAFGNPDNSLKYAEKEIELIKGFFSKSRTFLREKASEDRVKTGLNGFDILHLATHGNMEGDIKESHLLMAPSSDGREDGKLFIREIWGLPLQNYQLVTLSACETATGQMASGDVMLSLETAFLRAGTPTIVATLWEVDDQATGLLMKTFYENLKSQGRAEALKSAQLALRRDPRFAFPYYWAPFILVGDWR